MTAELWDDVVPPKVSDGCAHAWVERLEPAVGQRIYRCSSCRRRCATRLGGRPLAEGESYSPEQSARIQGSVAWALQELATYQVDHCLPQTREGELVRRLGAVLSSGNSSAQWWPETDGGIRWMAS